MQEQIEELWPSCEVTICTPGQIVGDAWWAPSQPTADEVPRAGRRLDRKRVPLFGETRQHSKEAILLFEDFLLVDEKNAHLLPC